MLADLGKAFRTDSLEMVADMAHQLPTRGGSEVRPAAISPRRPHAESVTGPRRHCEDAPIARQHIRLGFNRDSHAENFSRYCDMRSFFFADSLVM